MGEVLPDDYSFARDRCNLVLPCNDDGADLVRWLDYLGHCSGRASWGFDVVADKASAIAGLLERFRFEHCCDGRELR
jgi:hypothetical protein